MHQNFQWIHVNDYRLKICDHIGGLRRTICGLFLLFLSCPREVNRPKNSETVWFWIPQILNCCIGIYRLPISLNLAKLADSCYDNECNGNKYWITHITRFCFFYRVMAVMTFSCWSAVKQQEHTSVTTALNMARSRCCSSTLADTMTNTALEATAWSSGKNDWKYKP